MTEAGWITLIGNRTSHDRSRLDYLDGEQDGKPIS